MLTERCDLPEDFQINNYNIFQGKPSYLLNDGDSINLGGRTIQALHTLGHSPGHLCFWEEDKGFLFEILV